MVKNLPAVQETWVRSVGQEDPLEKGMAIPFSILAWRIPWTEGPGGLPFMESQTVGHDWATSTFLFPSLQRNSLPLAVPPHTLHLYPGQPLIYFVSLWICLFFTCHINEATQHVSFVAGIFWLGCFQGSSISYVTTSFLSIAKWYSIEWMCYILFTDSSVDGHSCGWFLGYYE